MVTVAIIPARGGSKQLPRKNILHIAGKPVIAHTIEHARQSALIHRVFVSTEDKKISAIARSYGAEVVMRPAELASDTASSESALLYTLNYLRDMEGLDPDLVVFLQCTSPIRLPSDIDNAVNLLLSQDADSLFSACRSHSFIWRYESNELQSINYDFRNRKRRQDIPDEFMENGSIYIFKPWVLDRLHNRLGGKIALYEMDYWSSFQIDSQADLQLCEWIMRKHVQQEFRHRLPSTISMIVLDFDGVFTDNKVLIHQDGNEAVLCNRADGLGLSKLRERGIPIAVLSTEKNPVVTARCEKLGIECYQGLNNKYATLKHLLVQHRIQAEDVIYVGNDINDLECIHAAGFGIAVADAHPAILAAAKIVLERSGGDGAIREVCDLILESHEADGAR